MSIITKITAKQHPALGAMNFRAWSYLTPNHQLSYSFQFPEKVTSGRFPSKTLFYEVLSSDLYPKKLVTRKTHRKGTEGLPGAGQYRQRRKIFRCIFHFGSVGGNFVMAPCICCLCLLVLLLLLHENVMWEEVSVPFLHLFFNYHKVVSQYQSINIFCRNFDHWSLLMHGVANFS